MRERGRERGREREREGERGRGRGGEGEGGGGGGGESGMGDVGALLMCRGAGCTGGGHTQERRPYAIEEAVHNGGNYAQLE